MEVQRRRVWTVWGQQKMIEEIAWFLCVRRVRIILLEPGINFIVFEKVGEINDDTSTCFSYNCSRRRLG